MRYFFKIVLIGLLVCIMSTITIGFGVLSVYFMKEALIANGIGTIVLFLFSIIIIVLTLLCLFSVPAVTYILIEKVEDSPLTTSKNNEKD